MRTKANIPKNISVGLRSSRGYRYDPRVERRRAQSYSRSRQWPMRPTRTVGPYAKASNYSMTTPGYPLGGKTAKTFTVQVPLLLNPYTIATIPVDRIVKGSGIDQRERDIVNLKGWKTRFHVHSTYAVPITMRFAFISPRQTLGANPTEQAIGLLRGYGPNRSVNLGLGNTGQTNCINPINDDLYMVMYQSKMEIGPTAGATGYTGGVQENWHSLEKWIPLNKQLRYFAQTEGKSETPIYLVFWFDSKIRAAGDAFSVISATGVANIRVDAIAYFHDRL